MDSVNAVDSEEPPLLAGIQHTHIFKTQVRKYISPLLGFLLYFVPFHPCALASSRSLPISEYVHDVWQTADGLPQNSVQAIAQTPDGYLWIATQEGLVRFDGIRFQVFDRNSNPELGNNDIRALRVTHDGSLWAGTLLGDLVRLKNGKFTSYTANHELGENAISAIYEDRRTDLWIGTRGGGLYRLRDGRFKSYQMQDGLANDSVSSIVEDGNGALWIGTDAGLSILSRGNFVRLAAMRGLPHDIIWTVYRDRQGTIWVGTDTQGLIQYQDGKSRAYTLEYGLSSNSVHAVREDNEGNLWVGTSRGLSRVAAGKIENYRATDGLSDSLVEFLFLDREGSLWIGTENIGLNRLRRGSVASHGAAEGLSVPDVWTVTQGASGDIWAGTDGGGLNRFANGKFTAFTTKQGLSGNTIGALYPAKDGSLWVGTNAGLDRLKDGKITTYTAKQGLPVRRESSGLAPSVVVKAIAEDNQGNLWFGTDGGGLCFFKNGKFVTYTTKNGLASDVVLWLTPSRAGGIWIATTKGLNRFDNGQISTFTAKSGLINSSIVTMYEDADGVLWIGTEGGLNRLQDGKFTAYTTRDGLFDDLAFVILEDSHGNLWMSCNKGIYRVSEKELNDFAKGLIKSVTSVSYGVADGMKSKECDGAVQPAGWRSRDGQLWFPTIQGLVTIDPNDLRPNPYIPTVAVEKITAGGLSIEQPIELQLPAGQRQLEFQFTAPSSISPEKIQFRYQLEGFDDHWVEAGTRRVAYYTNIPPGSYRFKVTASNSDGIWNTQGTSVKVRLAPYFYQAIWFYVICGVGVTLVIAALHQFRLRALRQRERVLARRVDERTAELRQEIAERQRSEWALQQTEEKYRAIFEDAVIGIFQATEDGRPLSINRAMAQIHGYDAPEQFLAEVSNFSNELFVNPKQMQEVMLTLEEKGVVRDIELEFYRKDRNIRWVRANIRAIRNPNGRLAVIEGTIEDITERKQAEARVQFLAYYDDLTALPNRSLLQDRLSNALAAARRRKEKVAVLFVDLDRFKIINDSLGHSVGDLLLREAAERLKNWARAQDTVARIGGDEFVMVLTGISDMPDAAIAAERIMDSMNAEFVLQNRKYNVTCSIGISIYPEHGTDDETLVKNADAAMYYAKESGRNAFRFFTDTMNAEVTERLNLEHNLRLALEKGELFLMYQPQIEAASGNVVGLEALIRWQHPELGLVPPDKFIRVAENSGLILPIGEWVIETACSAASEWQKQGLAAVLVAVNVSAVQFRQENFCDVVRRALERTGLPPQYLELELTEGLLLSTEDMTLPLLQNLKRMGVKLAIDDFGTGYSSLSYLRQFPVNKLKIDRSFIKSVPANRDETAITTAIISMAKSLNLKVTAEGVENEEQMSFLRSHYCDEIQGYYFSRPLMFSEALKIGPRRFVKGNATGV